MSDQILEDYKAYYSTRVERFAGNANYANSYEAEKQMSNAMQSCNVLEDFKENAVSLSNACTIALVKDENLMEKKHFEKHQEIVRVKASERILSKIDACATSMDVATMAVEETNKTSMEISMDEAHRQFNYDWDQIDKVIIYENAVVPEKYKQDMMNSAQDIKNSMIEGVDTIEKNNHEWQAGWRLAPEKNLEHRHVRLLPFSTAHITEQIALYKSIINR
ncbi:MAG: hypothetical protein CVU05_07005 [Bacteroidetes bacterium HGW-Bacteroidetes-21]|jgi:hypothetical protein|nr:MAG: hypothetical protein CVU05_07005 [Bacteroidetes bacterium HGW-Bacteroidetes-21]